jgi:hypothetical protein
MKRLRSFALYALAAFAAFAADVSAQGTIYWRNVTEEPNPSIHYKIPGDGGASAQFHVYPTRTTQPSGLVYGSGRQFLADAPLEPDEFFAANGLGFNFIPTTGEVNRVLLLMGETPTDYAPWVTWFNGENFNGFREWMNSVDAFWSNDNADTFLSFQTLRQQQTLGGPVPVARVLYRYDGSIDFLLTSGRFDRLSFTFDPFWRRDALPLPPAPPPNGTDLIEEVTAYDVDTACAGWDSTGTFVLLQTPDGNGGFVTSVFDDVTNATTIINDPAVSGYSISSPVFSPAAFRLFGIVETAAGARGLAEIDLNTFQFRFILQEGGLGNDQISAFRGPVVSPDGQILAFTLLRFTQISTITDTAPTLARISVAGGAWTPLWTTGHSTVNNFEPTGWKGQGNAPPPAPPPGGGPAPGGNGGISGGDGGSEAGGGTGGGAGGGSGGGGSLPPG